MCSLLPPMDTEQFEPLPREVIRRVLDAGLKLDLVPTSGPRGGLWSWSPGSAATAPGWLAYVRHATGPHCDKKSAGHGETPVDSLCRGLEELAKKFALASREEAAEAARVRLADRKASAAERAADLQIFAAKLVELSRSIRAAIPSAVAGRSGEMSHLSGATVVGVSGR